MAVKRRSSMKQVLAGLALVIVALVVVAVVPTGRQGSSAPGTAPPSGPVPGGGADRALGSMFQDDQHLVFSSAPVVTRTLDFLKGLGVDQIRATVVWKDVAPDAFSSGAPPRFKATDPGAY